MAEYLFLRSVSFDTSFLLKDSSLIDDAVSLFQKDKIACTVTQTVLSELEQLKVWGGFRRHSIKKRYRD